MFDLLNHDLTTHVPGLCSQCAPLRAFVAEHAPGLAYASMLGGQPGVALARSVADALTGAPVSARVLRQRVDRLHGLLTLRHVHDEERPEAGYFAQIDPGDPCVEEVCLLADGLHDALAASDALHAVDEARSLVRNAA